MITISATVLEKIGHTLFWGSLAMMVIVSWDICRTEKHKNGKEGKNQ